MVSTSLIPHCFKYRNYEDISVCSGYQFILTVTEGVCTGGIVVNIGKRAKITLMKLNTGSGERGNTFSLTLAELYGLY